MRTMRTSGPCLAYSRRYSAASTPNGATANDIRKTIITVPKIAGKIPPSVFDSRGSSVRNSHSRDRYSRSFAAVSSALGLIARTTLPTGISMRVPSAACITRVSASNASRMSNKLRLSASYSDSARACCCPISARRRSRCSSSSSDRSNRRASSRNFSMR